VCGRSLTSLKNGRCSAAIVVARERTSWCVWHLVLLDCGVMVYDTGGLVMYVLCMEGSSRQCALYAAGSGEGYARIVVCDSVRGGL
jgi:hypothetical protein